MPQRIVIDPVSRIEGHAKITIYLDDAGAVTDVTPCAATMAWAVASLKKWPRGGSAVSRFDPSTNWSPSWWRICAWPGQRLSGTGLKPWP